MTAQPPSHEEVQRIIEWLGTSWGNIGGKRVNFGEVLESLLADNVRLSGENEKLKESVHEHRWQFNLACEDATKAETERDQFRARIGELEQAGRITGWHMEGNLRVFDCITSTPGTTAYVKREDHDERTAALERALRVLADAFEKMEGTGYAIVDDARKLLASGTATGREG
jgi:regulator of replication initiation timing